MVYCVLFIGERQILTYASTTEEEKRISYEQHVGMMCSCERTVGFRISFNHDFMDVNHDNANVNRI